MGKVDVANQSRYCTGTQIFIIHIFIQNKSNQNQLH